MPCFLTLLQLEWLLLHLRCAVSSGRRVRHARQLQIIILFLEILTAHSPSSPMDVEHVVRAPNDKSMNAMTDKIPEEKTTENKTYKRQLNRKAPNQESRNVTQLESLEPKPPKSLNSQQQLQGC